MVFTIERKVTLDAYPRHEGTTRTTGINFWSFCFPDYEMLSIYKGNPDLN